MDDASPPRADTLDDLLRLARSYPALMSGDAIAPDADSFLRQFHSDFAAEDLAGLSAEDVLAAAETFWAWTARKAPDAQIVRIRPGQGAGNRLLGRDILEIAGPDMPFIVRSVMAELADQGASVLAMTHPVVETRRDTSGARSPGGAPVLESMIQIHLEPRTPEKAAALVRGVEATLADVRLAVADFRALKARMKSAADELAAAPGFRDEEERDEAVAFLRWLEDNHFTFLGARDYQYPRDKSGAFARDEPIILEDTGLGLLRDPDRYVLRRTKEPALLTPEIQNFLAEPAPVVVAKSSLQSRVHRRVTADYVGVKRYDGAGNVTGERRFIGLFTADAYNEVTSAIPLLRRKVRRVLAGSGAAPGSHNYSVLNNILETLPRDEMFQIGELELLSLALGVLHLSDRPRAKAFVRRDRFNRFVSALIYLPKERFNSTLRGKIGALLQSIYGGRVEAFYPLLGEGPLARVHYLIEDIDRARPDPDFAKLDADIAALTRTWEDEFDDAVRARVDPARADAFYDKLQSLSARGAIVLTHCISKMQESDGADPFVQKHVFPGYWFFSLEGETNRAVHRGFNVLDVETLRRHYAMTAHHWRANFRRNYDLIKKKMGFDDHFMKAWDFYLASVAGSFRAGYLNLIQMTMSQGINDEYPLTRDFLYQRERPRPIVGDIPKFPLQPRAHAPS